MNTIVNRYVVELPEDVAKSLLADAKRYRWIRSNGGCPYAETDAAWDTPEALDAAVDADIRYSVKPERTPL